MVKRKTNQPQKNGAIARGEKNGMRASSRQGVPRGEQTNQARGQQNPRPGARGAR